MYKSLNTYVYIHIYIYMYMCIYVRNTETWTSHVDTLRSIRTYTQVSFLCLFSYTYVSFHITLKYLRIDGPVRTKVSHDSVYSNYSNYSGHMYIREFPLKKLHPRNSPNRETIIPQYLVVQIYITLKYLRSNGPVCTEVAHDVVLHHKAVGAFDMARGTKHLRHV